MKAPLGGILFLAALIIQPTSEAEPVRFRADPADGLPSPTANSLTRLHAADVPMLPGSVFQAHFKDRDTLVPDLSPAGWVNGHELIAAELWDFSDHWSADVFTATLEPPDATCFASRCGFDAAGVQALGRVRSTEDFFLEGATAVEWDGVDTLWNRAGVFFEGLSNQAVFCFDPATGRPEVPALRFPHSDADGVYLQAGDGWGSAGWACEPVAWFFGGLCTAGTQAEANADEGFLGGTEYRVRGSGVVVLPSGHHLNSMLISARWSMGLKFAGCGDSVSQVEQLLYEWHAPKVGRIATLGTNRPANDPEGWIGAIASTFSYGLLPPLDTWVEENGNGWVRIAWDPGRYTDHVDRYKVYWDTDSGADSDYAFDSDSFPGLVTFDGTSAVIEVPDCSPRHFSVTSLSTHTDEDTGVPVEYESLRYPEQVFGDPDHAYPQEVEGRSAGDQVVTITPTPDPPSICGSGDVTLTASPGFVEYLWSDGQTGQSITVSLTEDGRIGVQAVDAGGCAPAARIDLRVDLPPDFDSVDAVDSDPCGAGLRLSWTPAAFHGPDGTGIYHVYRSEISCADALAGGPVATGLTGTAWTDAATVPGVAYYYVVEAEDSRGSSPCPLVGPAQGGAATRVCVDPPVVDLEDLIGPDSDVGWTLRASEGTEDSVFFTWGDVGLVDGERYRVGRADVPAGRPFDDISRGPMRDPEFEDRRAPDALYFYDVRVVDACGNLSDD
jgi:hypothetical protein